MSSNLCLWRLGSWLMSSPPAEYVLGILRDLIIESLSKGPVPQHISFIMDGNRRYARSHNIETLEGHNQGFEALARVLDLCYKCGVKVVTVYAFSTENFNRPRYEVDGLMQLAKAKLAQLSAHNDLLDTYGASVRILGERDRIPADVLEVCDEVVEKTKNNKDAILNVCFPYSSHGEITAAIRNTVCEYTDPVPLPDTQFNPARISRNIRRCKPNLQSIPELSAFEQSLSEFPYLETHPHGAEPDAVSSTSAKDDTFSSAPSSPVLSMSRFDPDESTPSMSSSYADSTPLQESKSCWPWPTTSQDKPMRHAASEEENDMLLMQTPETITAKTIDRHMYTSGCPPLDILIRTSGVTRLSDFMLWQAHQDTHIAYMDCNWPEFGFREFLSVLIEWQWRQRCKEMDVRPVGEKLHID